MDGTLRPDCQRGKKYVVSCTLAVEVSEHRSPPLSIKRKGFLPCSKINRFRNTFAVDANRYTTVLVISDNRT